MNKIEALKAERDGLDVRDAIARYAQSGWESITEDDVQRLKWYGLFLRNPTPGFFMVRVRIPGGRTSSYQLRALGHIAKTHGNGVIDLTTRQQVQLRHIPIESVPAVFDALDAVGLTTLQTGMDNIRNIMGCAVAGLSPTEIFDGSPIVKAFTDHFVGNREFTNLPRKFNVAMTGCPENCLHAETQDLALTPAESGVGDSKDIGFNVLIGGKLGSGGYRIASSLNVFVRPTEAVEICAAIVLLYRDFGNRELRTQNRLAFLIDEWGEARFREALEIRVKRTLPAAGRDLRTPGRNDHAGVFRQKQPGLNYVGLKIAVGRITAENLLAVAALAERYGTGEIRISPSQTLIVPNIPDRRLGNFLEEPLLTTLPYNASEVFKGLVSCVGNDYCNLAVIETKSRALTVAQHLEATLKAGVKPITMHWSGCPAGCGNHLVADIGLLGKRVKVDGEVVDAVDVYVVGRSGPNPKMAVKILEDVPCDKLPAVLEGLVPYHTRDKLHRGGRGKAVKPPAVIRAAQSVS